MAKPKVIETKKEELTLEERGVRASQEIGEVLIKYNLAFSVDLGGLSNAISSIKPILVEADKKDGK